MSNLDLYNKLRAVPQEAKKEIKGGRLSGMTDINPMWRLKMLTEQFGICGFGWKYVITEKRLETGANNQISAFVDIELFVKIDDKWSDAIQGTGGASFVVNESKGAYQSDECFKMALTDAISVACKALGMGADVYYQKDKTKYDTPQNQKDDIDLLVAIQEVKTANNIADLETVWKNWKGYLQNNQFITAVKKRKNELQPS